MKLDTHYNHLKVEKGRYEHWKKSGYFKSGDTSKPKFSVVIPPPNVTGVLHLGHAWDNTFQDIIARYKKAQGFPPQVGCGTDFRYRELWASLFVWQWFRPIVRRYRLFLV